MDRSSAKDGIRSSAGPHAEVLALEQAGEKARGATLYVTLEPCCHQGKTPPCTEAIRTAGIERVVAALNDPFPKVDGGGLRALEEGGVACHVGVMESRGTVAAGPLSETGGNRPAVGDC